MAPARSARPVVRRADAAEGLAIMSQIESTKLSVERIQNFDLGSLPRREELGSSYSFEEAVPPASRLINLFSRLPVSSFSEFPDGILGDIQSQADQVYKLFSSVISFDAQHPDPWNRRDAIITSISAQYDNVFRSLYPFISYSVARTVDFSRLEVEARAVVQRIEDNTTSVISEISNIRDQAQEALKEVRDAALEQGVSQQAIYFQKEANNEITSSLHWHNRTYITAFILIVFGALSFFIHRIPIIAPNNNTEAVTLIASKVLIFGVIAYMLVLSAKNFLAHKHNASVNRHRQNALQTFKALVDAAGSGSGAQDIVLTHAANCIFAPQETGFTKQSPTQNSSNVIDLAYRTMGRELSQG